MSKIVFDCVCGKHYRADSMMAGKGVKCRQCGRTIQIPIATPALAPVAPPPASQPAIPISINTAAPPRRRRAQASWGQIAPWVVAGSIGLGLMMYAVRQAQSDQAQAGQALDPRQLGAYLLAFPAIAVILIVFLSLVLPFVLPAILSQQGWLSVGRWASLAGFFITASAGVVFFAYQANNEAVTFLASFVWLFLFGSALGCFLASALYPKGP